MATTLTVSKLPNITIYTGDYSEEACEAIENRDYGHYIPELGYLSQSFEYNSYWSEKQTDTIFAETPVKYNNIGDIINSTISYMNKFKNNQVDIDINTNIIEFNFDYEKDLDSNFDNTYIIPSSCLYELLVNTNEMTFNKQKYYRNESEIYDITFVHKNFPYNKPGTVFVSDDENDSNNQITYNFSNEFVNYNYTSSSYEVAYTAYIYDDNGNKIEGSDHTKYRTEYSYFIKNVDYLEPRFSDFFYNNSQEVLNSFPDQNTNNIAYSISDLDTILNLTLNTYSLGRKNLIAYINFISKFNDWYNKTIKFETNSKLTTEDTITITPNKEEYFNITIGKNKVFGDDQYTGNDITFTYKNSNYEIQDNEIYDILNPENIKEIDLSSVSNKINKLDLSYKYSKRLSFNEFEESTWIKETQNDLCLESLNIGNETESKIQSLNGITLFKNLKTIDITNCYHLTKEFSIHNFNNLENFYAYGSLRKTFIPKANQDTFNTVELPNGYLNTIILRNNTIDKFIYKPNAYLVNLTLDNVTINNYNNKEYTDLINQTIQEKNIESFVNDWITSLKETEIKTKESSNKVKALESGLINNTILSSINFNYTYDQMIDLSYIGLNMDKLSGSINILDDLTREEYMSLRNIYGDDIMHIGKTNADITNYEFKLNYNINNNIFKKYGKLKFNNLNDDEITNLSNDHCLINISYTSNDRTFEYYSGHSLFDYIENHKVLTFNNKDIEGIGLQLTLNDTSIIADLNKEELITYANSDTKVSKGDILLYQGNKIILVVNKSKMIYNYIKLGTFDFNASLTLNDYNNIKEIILDFN